jgi:hypothetical protein
MARHTVYPELARMQVALDPAAEAFVLPFSARQLNNSISLLLAAYGGDPQFAPWCPESKKKTRTVRNVQKRCLQRCVRHGGLASSY